MIEDNKGIDKLRICKKKLRKLNKMVSYYYEEEITNPETLKEMLLISEIDNLITDVIYYIIDNKIATK